MGLVAGWSIGVVGLVISGICVGRGCSTGAIGGVCSSICVGLFVGGGGGVFLWFVIGFEVFQVVQN